MKTAGNNFLSSLLGILIYMGIIQHSDTGTIDLIELFFDPKPWIIALAIAAGGAIWENYISKKKPERTIN